MLREKSFSQEGFDSGQPAQFAQDDLSRYRWLFGIPQVVYKWGFWDKLFPHFFPHFSSFFQARTTFQILLKILKNTYLNISYKPFIA